MTVSHHLRPGWNRAFRQQPPSIGGTGQRCHRVDARTRDRVRWPRLAIFDMGFDPV